MDKQTTETHDELTLDELNIVAAGSRPKPPPGSDYAEFNKKMSS